MFGWLKNLASGAAAANRIPPDAPLESLSYTVVDTELTSLDSRSNRILSIGAVGMAGRRILLGKQFYRIANPGIPVPRETVLIHGLRPIDVQEGESPKKVVAEFLEHAEGTVLVGHFVSTDLAALRKELPDHGAFDAAAIDTARIHRWLDRQRHGYREDRGHEIQRLDLASVARGYGLEVGEVHQALYDAFLTAQLWQRLMAELETLRVRTWSGALRAGKTQ